MRAGQGLPGSIEIKKRYARSIIAREPPHQPSSCDANAPADLQPADLDTMAQEGEDIRSEIHDQRQLGYAVLKQVLKTEEVQELLDHYHRLRELDPANHDAFGSAETLGWFQVSPRVPGHRALRTKLEQIVHKANQRLSVLQADQPIDLQIAKKCVHLKCKRTRLYGASGVPPSRAQGAEGAMGPGRTQES